MGHYYSISSRLKVKADAPKELFAILDVLYEPIEGKRLKNDGLGYEELVIGFGNNACYMPFAPWTKEKTDYDWLYSHTGSSKHDWIDEIVALFRKYQEWFIFDKYDIAFLADNKVVMLQRRPREEGDGYNQLKKCPDIEVDLTSIESSSVEAEFIAELPKFVPDMCSADVFVTNNGEWGVFKFGHGYSPLAAGFHRIADYFNAFIDKSLRSRIG